MAYKDDTKLRQALGKAVRICRSELGLSQEAFAQKGALHRTYISSIERGGRNPSLYNLFRIVAALEMLPDEFVRLVNKLYIELKTK